jgi:Zn-dependent protease
MEESAKLFFLCLLSVLLHESGHALTAWGLGINVKSFRINIFGCYITRARAADWRHEVLICLAGPAVNLILFFCTSGFVQMFNLGMVIVNLVAPYSDGRNALKAVGWAGRV